MNNYNYNEEHYAEMYNNLPEGLKDLVLSGRLAIQVAAIGTRHGLNADQVADLEPAVEDVCLGLVLKNDLAENIKAQVGTDDRVSNRVAAEVEIEILRPFEPELVIARQQKEDLDKKIGSPKINNKNTVATPVTPVQKTKEEFEPKNVSEHSNVTAVKNFYSSSSNTQTANASKAQTLENSQPTNFDWDNFGKKQVSEPGLKDLNDSADSSVESSMESPTQVTGVEAKLDKLTDSINQLVNSRFGGEKKDEGMSAEMKKILERLEKAEKENEENKKLIKKLQGDNPPNTLTNIFGKNTPDPSLSKEGVSATSTESKIKIDKPRNVDIDKIKAPTTAKVADDVVGNVQVKTVSQNIPIQKVTEEVLTPVKPEVHMYSSTVTQDTADTIVETRNKDKGNMPVTTSAKKVLSLDELIKKGDDKIKEASKTTGQLVFPSISAGKEIDIKNIAQVDSLRQTLLEDLEFINKKQNTSNPNSSAIKNSSVDTTVKTNINTDKDTNTNDDVQDLVSNNTGSVTLNQFKDELMPKTKEDRMRALQDKIKAMNKGVSTGGANSIAATGLDPYKI